jgi:predicted HicB family RNase H-like nuclease
MTEKEMREFLKVVEESSEKALEEIKKEQVGSGQMSEFGYNIFASAVRDTIGEIKEDFEREANWRRKYPKEPCPSEKSGPSLVLEMPEKLMELAQRDADRQGKSLADWVIEALLYKLFI